VIDVLSLGAGVQSSCVLLMSCRGVLPKLDAAVFADTQWEPKAVYKHLAFLETEARSHGIPVYRVSRGDLRAEAIAFRRSGGKGSGGKRWASMPLYVLNADGSVGIINRQCTKEYKIEPVERCVRRQILGLRPRQRAPLNSVRHWFGISADEPQRVRKSLNAWQTFFYPLIKAVESPKRDRLFSRGFDRQDCLDWMEQHDYPIAPRSACIGCPFHSDEEWVRLRDTNPEAWADAVAFDKEIRAASAALMKRNRKGALAGLPFLHESCVPLDQVVFKTKETRPAYTLGMANECRGVCGV
jgi:hypothetical protein